ncbi:mitochondrial ribonuclease P catalytic subunit [Lycorma delicatula]|uniref:mitochondrial ribonuclease P catalytic subunit n=1 Tax=Lycorma delicatula TaxID=130591 RepID=UPI003F514130
MTFNFVNGISNVVIKAYSKTILRFEFCRFCYRNQSALRDFCSLSTRCRENHSLIRCTSYLLLTMRNRTKSINNSDKPLYYDKEHFANYNLKISLKTDREKIISEYNNYLCGLSTTNNFSEINWEDLKEKTLALDRCMMVNKKNVETIIMKNILSLGSLHFGRSYLLYLKNQNQNVNIVTSSVYLRLCYNYWSQHNVDDVDIIKSICDEIMSKLPLLDSKVAESLILGLCLIDRWKDSFGVIESLKEYYKVSSLSYSAVIKAAFSNRDFQIGWQLLEENMLLGISPEEFVYDSWLDTYEDKNVAINRLLCFFSKYDEKLSTTFAEKLLMNVKKIQHSSSNFEPSLTVVTYKGKCTNCKNNLRTEVLSVSEFNRLRTSFLDPVIIGKNIFLKSTPTELNRFQEFLRRTAPYDFVLDGLNIAYAVGVNNTNSTDVFANMLKSVVRYFVVKKKKVLVLGRKHMKMWPKEPMKYIENNANLFLTDNESEDDPYLLYATLYSGKNTNFVSRDLMRSHKYLLKMHERELNSLFLRWQYQHQYYLIYVLKNGDVIMKPPVKYLQSAHVIKGSDGNDIWHLPCKSEKNANVPGHKKFTMKKWLCLQF